MFERYYVRPATIDRIRANWLAPQIERYVEWMDSQGYATRNVYRRVPILCQFGEFANERGVADVSAAEFLVEEFATKWLANHGCNCRTPEARSKVAEEARNPVRQMLLLAAKGSVSANRKHKTMPFEREVPGFLRYLSEERGLQEATVRHYIHHLNRFAGYLGPGRRRIRRKSVTTVAGGLHHQLRSRDGENKPARSVRRASRVSSVLPQGEDHHS